MKTLIISAAIAALPLLAHADAAEDAVEARQGYFVMMGMNMGQLAGMAKGEIAYDEAAASRAAANIEALAGYHLPGLFIDGTSTDDMSDTEALPAIWANKDGFAARFAQLQEAAAGKSEAVKGGQANVGPAVQALGGACKACHDDFRKK